MQQRLGWFALVVVAACGPNNRDPREQIDAASTADAPPMICFEPSVSGTAMAGNTNVQGCAIWNNVSRLTGQLTLTRTGNAFTMAFANGLTFNGSITGSQVTLTHIEPHTFEDGCGWQSTETLTGSMDPNTCVLSLGYDYAEMITQSNGACASPCTGSADVTLEITPILQ